MRQPQVFEYAHKNPVENVPAFVDVASIKVYTGRDSRHPKPVIGSIETMIVKDRRRSDRLRVALPIEISWHSPGGEYLKARVDTQDVSAHGALLRAKADFLPQLGQIARIYTLEGEKHGIARVMRMEPSPLHGWTLVAIELNEPRESLWGNNLAGF